MSILQEPHVATLASELETVLRASCEGARSGGRLRAGLCRYLGFEFGNATFLYILLCYICFEA